MLEVGLAIGYSALHIARALPEYGKVVSLERDMQMAAVAKTYLARDPAGAKVEVLLGDAHDTLPGLRETFDMIFIDADKAGYPGYLDLALDRLRKRGLIVIDNLLMDGDVATGRGDRHWSQARSTPPSRSTAGSPRIPRSTTCSCRSATAWGSCNAAAGRAPGPSGMGRQPVDYPGARASAAPRRQEDP